MTTLVVSVTEFKSRCLDVIRRVERDGAPVDLTRRGKVVARLMPTTSTAQGAPSWLRLRGRGTLTGAAQDSVLDGDEFEAMGIAKSGA